MIWRHDLEGFSFFWWVCRPWTYGCKLLGWVQWAGWRMGLACISSTPSWRKLDLELCYCSPRLRIYRMNLFYWSSVSFHGLEAWLNLHLEVGGVISSDVWIQFLYQSEYWMRFCLTQFWLGLGLGFEVIHNWAWYLIYLLRNHMYISIMVHSRYANALYEIYTVFNYSFYIANQTLKIWVLVLTRARPNST